MVVADAAAGLYVVVTRFFRHDADMLRAGYYALHGCYAMPCRQIYALLSRYVIDATFRRTCH